MFLIRRFLWGMVYVTATLLISTGSVVPVVGGSPLVQIANKTQTVKIFSGDLILCHPLFFLTGFLIYFIGWLIAIIGAPFGNPLGIGYVIITLGDLFLMFSGCLPVCYSSQAY